MTELLSRENHFAAVLAAGRALGMPEDPQRLLETLVETACSHTAASAGAIWLSDDEGEGLTLAVPSRNPPTRLGPRDGMAGRCAHAGAMLHVRDPEDVGPASELIAADLGPEAVLNLPLPARDGAVLGVLQLLHAQRDGFTDEMLSWAQLVVTLAGLMLENLRLDTSAQQASRLHDEVEVAREIQRSTLPDSMPQVTGYDLHGHFQPATYAGGDMFDVVQLEHGVFLLLGDATGHGFGPALSAVQMQGMLRLAFRLGADLDHAFLHVNNQLSEDLPADRFITAFMGFLDPGAHTVSYHSAGQGPILHFHAADGHCDWHRPDMFPVGVLGLDEVKPAISLPLAPGDILALISDGLYEQIGTDGSEFGQDRVGAILQRDHALPMAEVCRNLMTAVERFAVGCAQADDITMILVRRLP
ncbi:MAG TPA: SpoIIE family protein phosphatase [Rhodanobacteraceae bacterium]|nr:SpoIIE family protein phosphatase [Rhodanobacteraceae bacterium]